MKLILGGANINRLRYCTMSSLAKKSPWFALVALYHMKNDYNYEWCFWMINYRIFEIVLVCGQIGPFLAVWLV